MEDSSHLTSHSGAVLFSQQTVHHHDEDGNDDAVRSAFLTTDISPSMNGDVPTTLSATQISSKPSSTQSKSMASMASCVVKVLARYLILAMCCLLCLGSYYCYDIPGTLRDQMLKEPYTRGNPTLIQLWYTVYSIPNTVVVFFGGLLIDKFLGVRLGSLSYSVLTMLGQIIFAVGATFGEGFAQLWLVAYSVMLSGRFVFALGGESIGVAQSVFIAKWFSGRELALAFGISLSASRISSALALDVVAPIGNTLGVPIALWSGVIVCVVSVVAVIVASFVDRFGEKNDYVKDVSASDPMSLRDILQFPITIYIMLGLCVTFYIPFFTFTSFGVSFFKSMYDIEENYSGVFASISLWVSALCLPVFGFMVDRIRHNPHIFLASAIGLSISLLTLLFVPKFNFVLMVTLLACAVILMGISYSLFASAYWPSVPYAVEKKVQGTAYGLIQAGQNLGLAIASLIAGLLQQFLHATSWEYPSIFIFFLFNSVCCIGLSILLIWVDSRNGYKLSRKTPPPVFDPQQSHSSLERDPLLAGDAMLKPEIPRLNLDNL